MTDRDKKGSVLMLPPSDEEQRLIELAQELLVVDPEVEEAVRARLESVDLDVRREQRRINRRRSVIAVAAAAGILLAALVGRQLWTAEPAPPADMVVETGPTQVRTISPAAGIDVGLRENTDLSILTGVAGEISLTLRDGGVDVAYTHTSGAPPLSVHAGNVVVSVTGTRFTVTRRGDRVTVEVESGTVEVVWPGGEASIGAGGAWQSWPEQVDAIAEVLPVETVVEAPALPPAEDRLAVVHAVAGTDASADLLPEPEPADVSSQLVPGTSSETVVFTRILMNRGADLPAADRLADLDLFLNEYPGSNHAEEVLALKVEALADSGRDADALAVAEAFCDRYPSGARRQQVRWIEATVARDRLLDCDRALDAYRELAEQSWPRQAEASFYRGVCAADRGMEREARGALEAALAQDLAEPHAGEARDLLQNL